MDKIEIISIEKNDETQIIIGHSSFIKTVEDLYEAMITSVPNINFGLAFAEASGLCLIRSDGNDDLLIKSAEKNLLKIAAGHTFLIFFKNAYPINVINNIKNVSEVVRIYCATANPTKVLVYKTNKGNSILGIIDGDSSKGIENKEDKINRKKFLRDIGYKR